MINLNIFSRRHTPQQLIAFSAQGGNYFMDSYAPTRIERVNRKRPCVICAKDDFCGRAANGAFAICMRVRSENQTKNGGYLHRLRADDYLHRRRASPPARPPQIAHTSNANHKSAIYSRLLSEINLSSAHRESLLARGLTQTNIETNLYRSLPSREDAQQVARLLAPLNLNNTPGFFRSFDTWNLRLPQTSGFFIPVRDSQNRIIALQIRLDEGGARRYIWFSSNELPSGASTGAPVHLRGTHPKINSLFITEGALKADVIFAFEGEPIAALAGVSTVPKDFTRHLKARFPFLKRVTLLFDMDFQTNEHVHAALFRLVWKLKRGGFQVLVKTWSREFKGYDDYLLENRKNANENHAELCSGRS